MDSEGPGIDILMYHSISNGRGPGCIAPATFARQMAILEECGYRAVPLADVAAWLCGGPAPPPRSVVLTFDDAYADFASVAHPELAARNWPATVFLPTAYAGRAADWDATAGGRPVMSWATVVALADHGVEFGAHGVRHADLTAVAADDARDEVVHSKWRIAENTGRPVRSFAAPYGHTIAAVRAEIARHYDVAVGTTLARVDPGADPYDLPRIEMWYFRDADRWRAYLQGRARGYLFLRQFLRRARAALATGAP